MPLVNLIQEQRQAIRHKQRQTRMVLLSIVGVGVLSFLTAGYFTFETVRYTLRTNDLKATKERLKPLMDQVEQNEQMIGSLQVKMDTLGSAEKSTVRWSGLLTYLAANTPNGVWLSDLRSTQPDAKSPVSLGVGGLSVDQDRVGQFILRLEAAQQVEGVMLKYTQEKVGPNSRSTQFELNAVLEGTTPKPEASEASEVKS